MSRQLQFPNNTEVITIDHSQLQKMGNSFSLDGKQQGDQLSNRNRHIVKDTWLGQRPSQEVAWRYFGYSHHSFLSYVLYSIVLLLCYALF